MLVLGLDVPLWIALILVAVVLLYWYGTSTYGVFKEMGVPFVPPYPFMGSLIEQLSTVAHEYDKKWQTKLGTKVYGNFQGMKPMLDVADVEFIKTLTMNEFTSFSNRRIVVEDNNATTSNIAGIHDDHWKHVRSILTPTFTSGKLKQMHSVITNCAEKLAVHLKRANSEPLAVKDYTGGYTMDVIASTAFGLDIDSQTTTKHPFIIHAQSFFGTPHKRSKLWQRFILVSVFLMPKSLKRFISFFLDLQLVEQDSLDYFEHLVDKILAENDKQLLDRNDFISICQSKLVDIGTVDKGTVRETMGRTWSTQGLTKNDLMANAFIFLVVGYETTASALQFFLYNMALNPDIQEKLHNIVCEVATADGNVTYEQLKKLDYLDWCINESLRMFPPAVRMDRVANKDACIQGINIPKGMIVNCLIYSVHHDPEYWPQPETYNPERFAPENKTEIQQNAFLPFGQGNRSCIASRLALLELRVAAVKLMATLRFERTAETPDYDKLKFKTAIGLLDTATPLKLCAVPRS